MIELLALAAVVIVAAVIAMWIFKQPDDRYPLSSRSGKQHPQDKSYAPGLPASSAGPLPLRGREERKKTETFRRNE